MLLRKRVGVHMVSAVSLTDGCCHVHEAQSNTTQIYRPRERIECCYVTEKVCGKIKME